MLLYNGYYCFEAITERDIDEVICGVCGIIGEVYLGDGNEKNCCSNKNVSCQCYFGHLSVIHVVLYKHSAFSVKIQEQKNHLLVVTEA